MYATTKAHATAPPLAGSVRRVIAAAVIVAAVVAVSVGPIAAADAREQVRQSQQAVEKYKAAVNTNQTSKAD